MKRTKQILLSKYQLYKVVVKHLVDSGEIEPVGVAAVTVVITDADKDKWHVDIEWTRDE